MTAISIGTFDGVHLGHLDLFSAMRRVAPKTALALFDKPPHTPPLGILTPLPLKLSLLPIDDVILLSFTPEFASLTYQQFLDLLHSKIPFTDLVLGQGAAFGKGREGTEEKVRRIAKGFTPHYIPKTLPASSTTIRRALSRGDLATAEALLGRPVTYRLPADPSLCLPPPGIYKTHEGPTLTIAQDRTLQLSYPLCHQISLVAS